MVEVALTSATLTPSGKILIVGSKPSNFSGWLKGKPEIASRLKFWESLSTNGKKSERKNMPKFVEMIIFTRFISHAEKTNIEKQAHNAGVNFFRSVHGTGEIKTLVEEMLFVGKMAVEKSVQPVYERIYAPVQIKQEREEEKGGIVEEKTTNESIVVEPPTVEQKKWKKPAPVQDFVFENANFSAKSPKIEIGRLLSLAQEKGVGTTERSVGAVFFKLRKLSRETDPTTISAPVKIRRDSFKVIEEFLSLSEMVKFAIQEIAEENRRLKGEISQLTSEIKVISEENRRLKTDLKKKVRELLSGI